MTRMMFTLLLCASLGGCAGTLPAEGQGPVSISLDRSQCFGFCPAYTVVLSDDGQAVFTGEAHTAFSGTKTYAVAPDDVRALRRFMEDRDFWKLKDKYQAGMTDQVWNTVCLTVGTRKKCVIDYRGTDVGMPQSVKDIEAEIDRVGQTAPLIGNK